MNSWGYNNRSKEFIDKFITKCEENTKENELDDNPWKRIEDNSTITIIAEESSI